MRSKWKGAYIASSLLRKLNISMEQNKPLIITERNSTIIPEFVNKQVRIHNGKDYKLVDIRNEHIGLKFGELAMPKKSAKYKQNGTKN